MANGVEERIVAAKFDSSDFEKGVDKTVKKLDELKESLDMKKTGEVLEKASEKANKSMDSLSKSVENLNNRFTSFWGMVKQNIVGGLAQKVSDVFMNMTNAVTGFVKSLSSTQMHAGLAQYEQLLTSVRMITNATYIDDKTGKKMNYTEEAAYEAMNKIVTYSDETSYSIDQMSDAMSKMVAAGVPLSKAADNVMGIANACAFAGVNATDAARAFFNLSQAYSSGSLKYTDYRSLELLNMTNEGFQEQLLKAGEEAGVLKKVKDGTWKTQKSDKNKKVTAGKTVTRQTLSESLKYNWASTDVMDQLFGKNFYANIDEIEDMLYTKGMSMAEVTKHISENYGEVAAKAFAAAREARSFTDVMNTFKGIVSAGWSKTFERLFGQLSQATKFFTDLADGGIANFIRQIGAWRNGVLDVWNAGSGGENFRQIILDIDAALGYHNTEDGEHPGLLNILTDLFPKIDDFGTLLSKASHDAAVEVQHFRQFIIDAVDFMNTKMPDGMSRMDRLRKIFGQLSGAFSAIGRVLGIVTKRIQIVWTIIDPIFIGITNALLKITEPIEELGSGKNMQPFNDLANALDNVCIILRETMKYLGPFIETVGTIIGEIGKFIVGMSIDTVAMNIQFFGDIIRLFIDLFGTDEMKQMAAGQSVLEGMKNDIQSLIDVCKDGIGAVGAFLSSLIKDIRTLFGLSNEGETSESGEGVTIWSNIKNFFDTNEFIAKVKAWFEQAKVDIKKWFEDIPTKIKEFISGLLTPKKEETITEGSDENKTISAQLKEWFDGIVNSVKEFVLSIPERIRTAATELGDMAKSFIHNLLYDKITVWEVDEKGKKTNPTELEVDSPIKIWFEKLVNSVREFIVSLPSKIKTLASDLKEAVKKWIHGLFYDTISVSEVDEKGRKTNKTEVEVDSPLKIWLTKFINDTKEFIRTLPGKIKALASDLKKSIQKYIHGLLYKTVYGINQKTGYYGLQEVPTQLKVWIDNLVKSVKDFIKKIPEHIQTAIKAAGSLGRSIIDAFKGLFGFKDAEKAVEEDASRITFDGVINSIKSIAKTLINEIISLFTGTDDMEANFKWFGEKISGFISQIPEYMRQGLNLALTGIGSIWDMIYKLIAGEDTAGNKEGHASELAKTIDKEFGKDGGDKSFWGVIQTIPTLLGSLFEDVRKLISPVWEKLIDWIWSDELIVDRDENGHIRSQYKGFRKVAFDMSNAIVETFKQLPGWITTGINSAVKWIDEAIQNATGFITDLTTKGLEKANEESGEKLKKSDEGTENGGLGTALHSIGESLYNLIIKTIPEFISAGWEYLRVNVGTWFDGFLTIFDGIKPDDPEFNNTAKRLIGMFSGWWDSIMNIKVGTKGYDEKGFALNLTLREAIENFIKDLPTTFTNAFNTAKESLLGFWNTVMDTVVGERTTEYVDKDNNLVKKTEPVTLKQAIIDFIKNLPDEIEAAWNSVSGKFSEIWNNIMNFQVGWKYIDRNAGPGSALERVPLTLEDAINDFINSLPQKFEDAITTAKTELGNFWTNLINIFNGEETDKVDGKSFGDKIADILANIPALLAEGLEKAIKAIDWVFEQLSNLMTSAASEVDPVKALEEKAKEAEKAAAETTGDAVEKTGEAVAEETDESKIPKNRLLAAFSNIGAGIMKLITQTIPGFVSDGFNYVRDHWDEWISGIFHIFDKAGEKDGGLDANKIDTKSIGDKIIEALKKLPEIIRNAWASVKSIIDKIFKKPIEPPSRQELIDEKKLIRGINPKKISGDVKDKLDKTGEDVKEDAEESSFWEDLVSVGQQIGDALMEGVGAVVDNIGPIFIKIKTGIIKVWSTFIKILNSLITGEGDIGDIIKDELGLDIPEISKTITEVWSTIEDAIFIQLPKLIAGLLAKLVANIGSIATSIVDTFKERLPIEIAEAAKNGNGNDADAKKTGEAITGSIGFIEGIINLIRDFITSMVDENGNVKFSLSTVLVVVIGLFMLITTIKNFWKGNTSGTENRARTAEAKNSLTAMFKAFLNLLTVFMIVAGIAAVIPEEQFNRMKWVIEQMSALVDKIVPLLWTVSILQGGPSLFESIQNLFKKDTDRSNSGDQDDPTRVNWVDKLLNTGGILEELTDSGVGSLKAIMGGATAAAVTEMVGTSLSDIFEQFMGDFELLSVSLSSFKERIDKNFKDIDAALETLGKAGQYITKVGEILVQLIGLKNDKEQVYEAITIMNDIAGSFHMLVDPFKEENHFEGFKNSLLSFMGSTKAIDDFVLWVNGSNNFSDFKYAIATLGTVLSFSDFAKFSSTTEVSDEQINSAIDIIGKIIGNENIQGLIETLSSKVFSGNTEMFISGIEKMVLFGNGLTRLAEGVSGFNSESTENLREFFNALSEIQGDSEIDYENPGWEYRLGDTSQGMNRLSSGLFNLAGGLSSFIEEVDGLTFDDQKMKNAMSVLADLAQLAETLTTVGAGWLTKAIYKGENLTTFGEKISTLGGHIATFMNDLKPAADSNGNAEWDMHNVMTAMYAISNLAHAAKTLNTDTLTALETLLDEKKNIAGRIVSFVNSFIDISINNNIKGTSVEQDTLNLFNSFKTLCVALGSLKGVNVHDLMSSLSASDWGLEQLASTLTEVFRKIAYALSTTYNVVNEDKKVIRTYKINSKEIRDFFDAITGLFIALGTMVTPKYYQNSSYNKKYLSNYFEDVFGALTAFSDNVEQIFSVIDAFAAYDDTEGKLEKAEKIIGMLNILSNLLFTYDDEKYMLSDSVNAFTGLKFDDVISFVNRFISALDASISTDEKINTLKNTGKSMAEYIYSGIQEVFNSDPAYEIKIAPVLDDTNIRSKMSELFEIENPSDFNFGSGFAQAVQNAFTTTSLADALNPHDYAFQLNEMSEKMDTLDNSINGIATAFNGAKLVADTGALAVQMGPDIDRYLAEMGVLYLNHVATR